jgi:hypothetical protein
MIQGIFMMSDLYFEHNGYRGKIIEHDGIRYVTFETYTMYNEWVSTNYLPVKVMELIVTELMRKNLNNLLEV